MEITNQILDLLRMQSNVNNNYCGAGIGRDLMGEILAPVKLAWVLPIDFIRAGFHPGGSRLEVLGLGRWEPVKGEWIHCLPRIEPSWSLVFRDRKKQGHSWHSMLSSTLFWPFIPALSLLRGLDLGSDRLYLTGRITTIPYPQGEA